MLPIKHSTIFKSRWWALIWAAGVCWTAIDVAQSAGGGSDENASANASASAPDADGDVVDGDAAKKAAALLQGI